MSFIKKSFSVKSGHRIYTPENPDKYVGKDSTIICRSSYEEKFCRWLDINSNVLEWASEALEIPYFDPIQKKKRRYYPDYYMKVKNKDGKIEKFIIEVKPYKETIAPKKHGRKKQRTLLREQKTWVTNKAKWNACINWCKKQGYQFKLITEKQLFK